VGGCGGSTRSGIYNRFIHSFTMQWTYAEMRRRLQAHGLWPEGKLARTAWYVLGLAVVLFLLQRLLASVKSPYGDSLGGWISFLSFISIVCFLILLFRWLKQRILWRLRNRLIVTYVFIGVIPVLLLMAMAAVTIYLFAGQFAGFVITSEIETQLRAVESANAAIANELAARIETGDTPTAKSLEGLRRREKIWAHREVCAWHEGKPLPLCTGAKGPIPFEPAGFVKNTFRDVVHDQGRYYMRAATVMLLGGRELVVISSDELDKDLVEKITGDLGKITLYTLEPVAKTPDSKTSGVRVSMKPEQTQGFVVNEGSDKPNLRPVPMFSVGKLPESTGSFDREIAFGSPVPVVDWVTGKRESTGALLRVLTRPSVLYRRLFASLADFARGVELLLLAVAIFFAIIELVALYVGTRLTRSITSAVAHIYQATQYVDKGDFSHRIPVKSTDQLAQLSHSFNAMTASIEKLVAEQKEKQRLENELAIAQEVQATLFPKEISQLPSLEVHGFCRPARTVSGDYYDFLSLNSEKLILAVGDISGKGISAALLMATIHSAVRAYSLENPNLLREAALAGQRGNGGLAAHPLPEVELSPSALLTLLNRQLYESTPMEKYATLFLGMYDARSRRISYSNGGHLPPMIIGPEGGLRRLDCGGTVVGLFDAASYDEASVEMRPGEIFVAYSDGVTEPENEFGEFGERRLIELVREHRGEPLVRITEAVTAAVDDWIGPHEQPDDVTLVLARAR
jgi:sigma-B regulation protein RsbU (phosphoserine phosphatase)